MAINRIILPSYFMNGMVLQQHAPVELKGMAPPNTPLAMELTCRPEDGHEYRALDRNFGVVYSDNCVSDEKGNFDLYIPALEASFNIYSLTIYSVDEPTFSDRGPYDKVPVRTKREKVSITIDDILVGEVWVTGGEGNMEMPLYAAAGGDDRKLLDNNRHIRVFVQNAFGLDPEEGEFRFLPQRRVSGGFWTGYQDFNDLRHVSAISAYFAVEMLKALRTPIGIIDTALAESMIHTWIDRRTIENDPTFVEELKKRKLWCDRETWKTNSKRSMRQPSVFFNHKISPFRGMNVRGFIFAQGENEVGHTSFYERAFALQLRSWQKIFRPVPGEHLNVIYTGLAPCLYIHKKADALPRFNLMLARMRHRLPLPAAFVAIHDLSPEWEKTPDSWRSPRYPADKRSVAQRISTVALGMTYHRKAPKTSPEISRVKRVDNKLMLSFRYLDQSLCLKSGDKVLKGFAVCGEDKVFRPAIAKLLYGMQVMVWHPDVPIPRQVTYAYQEMGGVANLCTGENLTVATFSTAEDAGLPAAECEWALCDGLKMWGTPPSQPGEENKFDESDEIRPVQLEGLTIDVVKKKAPESEAEHEAEKRIVEFPGGVLSAEWIPLWRPIAEADIRMRIDNYNFQEGVGSLEVSYAGDRADLPILAPELDALSMRPRLNLHNYDRLKAWVFNPDGRDKELRLEGTKEWLKLIAGLHWQLLVFDLKPLREKGKEINQLRIRILDKNRSGMVLFDHFEFEREMYQPYARMMPSRVEETVEGHVDPPRDLGDEKETKRESKEQGKDRLLERLAAEEKAAEAKTEDTTKEEADEKTDPEVGGEGLRRPALKLNFTRVDPDTVAAEQEGFVAEPAVATDLAAAIDDTATAATDLAAAIDDTATAATGPADDSTPTNTKTAAPVRQFRLGGTSGQTEDHE